MGPQICGFPAVGCRKEHPDRGCPLASDESSGDAPGGLKDAALGTRESGARTTRVSEKSPSWSSTAQGGAFGTTRSFAPEHPGDTKGRSQSPHSLEGDTGMNCSPKKGSFWDGRGAPKCRFILPCCGVVSCLRPGFATFASVITSPSEERGKFFLFWVWREAGCAWRGEAAPGASPAETRHCRPRHPAAALEKGWKSPRSKGWQSGSFSIAQPWQFGAVSVPGTAVPQFPPRS